MAKYRFDKQGNIIPYVVGWNMYEVIYYSDPNMNMLTERMAPELDKALCQEFMAEFEGEGTLGSVLVQSRGQREIFLDFNHVFCFVLEQTTDDELSLFLCKMHPVMGINLPDPHSRRTLFRYALPPTKHLPELREPYRWIWGEQDTKIEGYAKRADLAVRRALTPLSVRFIESLDVSPEIV